MRQNRERNRQLKEYHPNPTCDGKRFFATESEALEAADVRMLEHMSLTLGVYQCPTCLQWHLTRIKSPDNFSAAQKRSV